MKKVTLIAIKNALTGYGYMDSEVLSELNREITRGDAQKEANQAVYTEIHDAVIKALTSAENPVTAQELADETGYPKGKIVYGLSHYWGEEIEKIEGKVNTYALKA